MEYSEIILERKTKLMRTLKNLHLHLVKLFRRRMQNYAILSDKFIQHYVIRGDISPHFRRLITVNDRF